MELIEMKLENIHPYERNPRKNDGAVSSVAESIKQCGYVAPIIVDEDHVILAGHTRLKALKKLGYKTAPVVIKEGLTDEQKRKYRILDNKTGELAEWDDDLLKIELIDLDFGDLDLDFGGINYSPENYEEEFSLPNGEKSEICQMTFTLHNEQANLIKYAIENVKNNVHETFGNTNSNGNALYEVVFQWVEQKK